MLTSFFDWTGLKSEASSWNQFPTPDEPNAKYKFVGLEFKQGKSIREINRETYSLLDWLGDWGGLMDALFMIAEVIVAPFSAIALKARLVAVFARVKVSDGAKNGPSETSALGRELL